MATKPTPSKLADTYQTYPTANAAAVAALRGITSKNVETGGGILYNKAQNVYAATQAVGQSDGSHFSASVGVPQGWQLHSTYHTHPAGPRSTMFSGDDIDTASQLKAPSYILTLGDNKIKMFDPASSKVSKDSSWNFSDNRYSNGSIVNEAPPAPAAPTPSVATSAPAPTQAQPVADATAPPAEDAPDATVPVAGSRITMKEFATKHRVKKYKHKIVHIR
jgi:hypothetical protein